MEVGLLDVGQELVLILLPEAVGENLDFDKTAKAGNLKKANSRHHRSLAKVPGI